MKAKLLKAASIIASLAFAMAVSAAGTASYFGACQPKEPECLRK